jgi:ABC-type dipeptide/oligopeptide/nickel transport system permease component
MLGYIFWRLIKLVLTAFVVLTLVFIAFRLVPGDPAQLIAGQQTQEDVERVREYLGLSDPIHIQYLRYINGILHGSLGVSAIYMEDVAKVIFSRIPATLLLLGVSILITIVVGITIGVISAVRHNSLYDYATVFFVVAALSIPNFWLGLLMMNLFSIELRWLPTSGFRGWASLIMPALAISARLIAIVARMTRANMLEVLREDYVQVARAKGVREGIVVFKHALRNALIPTVTVIGLQVGYLLGGSVVVEVLFSWPGIGHLLINAISMRDYAMVQGITVVYVVGFLLVNLGVDILYGFLDPRIR